MPQPSITEETIATITVNTFVLSHHLSSLPFINVCKPHARTHLAPKLRRCERPKV